MTSRFSRFKKTTTQIFATALVAGLLVPVAACSGGASRPDAKETGSVPVRGGVLHYGTKSEPGNGGLDPMTATVYSSTAIINQIYEPLIVKDDSGELQPNLATEWNQVDDLTYDFTVRKGVKFADGSDLTVSDVIWTFQYAKDKSPQSKAALLKELDSITDKGNNVIEFRFKKPNPSFLSGVADRTYGFYIIDQQWYENASDTERQTTSNGTGPFALKAWNKGTSVELERNKHYWQEGKPYLDGISFDVTGDETSLLALVQQGQVDAAWFWKPELAQQAKDAGWVLGDLQQTSTRFLFIDPHYDKGVLADTNIRKALSKAIDRNEIISIGTQGRGSLTFATPPAFTELEQASEDAPNYTYDPEGAKKLLADSSNPHPTISVAYDAESADAAVFELLKDQVSKVGINLELRPVPYEQIQGIFTTGDDFIADLVYVQDVIGSDPADSISWWLETGSNVDRWGSDKQAAEAKALLAKIKQNTDAAERVEQINELNDLINRDVLTITPFATPLTYQVWSSRLHGYKTDPSDFRYHLADAWLS